MDKPIFLVLNNRIIETIPVYNTTTIKDILEKSRNIIKRFNLNPDTYNLNFKFSQTVDLPTYILYDKRYENISPYDQMVKGESYLIYNKVLTGNKQADLLVLNKLDDRDLLVFCISNKYISKLCEDENFWHTRFIERFGIEASKYKPKNRSWKNHYLRVIADLDEWSVDPWTFFDETQTSIDFDPNNYGPGMTEKQKNGFWLLNLGNHIRIHYPIDRYQESEFIVREYKTDKYFTPSQVFELMKKFYEERVTREELDYQQQELDNPYAEDYDENDIGKITRADLLGPLFFEGFNNTSKIDHIVIFGS